VECRWCFAIDLQRVKAIEIAEYKLHDALIVHMKCNRCGGEYSSYTRIGDEEYIKERIISLYPEIQETVIHNIIPRVKAKEISEYRFPDALIIQMKCNSCGGEYSSYTRIWDEEYIKERIVSLNPEIQGPVLDNMILVVTSRLWPEELIEW